MSDITADRAVLDYTTEPASLWWCCCCKTI